MNQPSNSKLKSIVKKSLLLCLSILVSCLLLEAAVLLTMGEQAKFPRHVVGSDFGVRINEPNASYRHKSADVCIYMKINSQGMRADRDFPYEKPPGVKRIVSLGDSFTIGYEVEADESFSSVLEKELNAKGYRVEVLNTGVSGYSTAEACVYLERELHKYDPDLVLVSYFGNDLHDSIRTGLFRLEDGQLIEASQEYVPAGKLGNFLNTNWFFNLLSERSNAFVAIKEAATHLVKRNMVRANIESVESAQARAEEHTSDSPQKKDRSQPRPKDVYAQRLAGAIYERMREWTQHRDIPLLVHSIPSINWNRTQLTEMFPLDHFDVNQPGVHFLAAKDVLEPHVDSHQLYWDRSHGHWTPFSHAEAGKALAELVIKEELLGPVPSAP